MSWRPCGTDVSRTRLLAFFAQALLLARFRADASSSSESDGWSSDDGPHGIHLELAGDPNKILVFFMTKEQLPDSTVRFGTTVGQASGAPGGRVAIGASKGVRYSESKDRYRSEFLHTVQLTGLDPGSVIFYTVGHPSHGWSKPRRFSVRRAAQTDVVRIIAFGDQAMTKASKKLIQQILEEPVDANFIWTLGDISYANTKQVIWDKHADFTDPLFSRIPVLAGIGNHEQEFGKFEAFTFRWRHTDKADSMYWFSHVEGPVHTFSLSCEHELSPGSPQYQWLESVLKMANEPTQRRQIPWIVGMNHKPAYTSGTHRENTNLMKILDPLLRKYNVNVMVYGHDHNYERSYPAHGGSHTSTASGELSNPYTAHTPFSNDNERLDTIHIVAGTGGKRLRTCRQTQSYSKTGCIVTHGYGIIEASRQVLTWSFKDIDGSIRDEFRICSSPECADVKSHDSSGYNESALVSTPAPSRDVAFLEGPAIDPHVLYYFCGLPTCSGVSNVEEWCSLDSEACADCGGEWCSSNNSKDEGSEAADVAPGISNSELPPDKDPPLMWETIGIKAINSEAAASTAGTNNPSQEKTALSGMLKNASGFDTETNTMNRKTQNPNGDVAVGRTAGLELLAKNLSKKDKPTWYTATTSAALLYLEEYQSCAACGKEETETVCAKSGLPIAPNMCVAINCLKIDTSRESINASFCL